MAGLRIKIYPPDVSTAELCGPVQHLSLDKMLVISVISATGYLPVSTRIRPASLLPPLSLSISLSPICHLSHLSFLDFIFTLFLKFEENNGMIVTVNEKRSTYSRDGRSRAIAILRDV